MKDDIILAEVEGEGMMIDVERSTSYFLNETALLITKMVNDGKTVEEIKSALLEQYEVGEEELEEDILDFMDRLEKKAPSWKRKNT